MRLFQLVYHSSGHKNSRCPINRGTMRSNLVIMRASYYLTEKETGSEIAQEPDYAMVETGES
jgi:hypothetical protein